MTSDDEIAVPNVFEGVITAEVVTDILKKQVEKARAGNTSAASLILKIAMAKAGQDSSSRRNPGAQGDGAFREVSHLLRGQTLPNCVRIMRTVICCSEKILSGLPTRFHIWKPARG